MIKHLCLGLIYLLGCIDLVGCGIRDELAPVEEIKWVEINRGIKFHTVQKGETLYAIAFRYDKDFHQLAYANNLSHPYSLRVGQRIRLQASSTPHVPKVVKKTDTVPSKQQWIWPAKGKIVKYFAPHQGQKGITIAGRQGENIYAAASGVVAYAGNGLPGYGNLVIIKHDDQYLTAYAHNQRVFVHEGQRVDKGTMIAKMGLVERHLWGLHFEMRKLGSPVNPLNYLRRV